MNSSLLPRNGRWPALAAVALAVTGCVSGEQRNAADDLERVISERDGVLAADVSTWADSASLDNATLAVRLASGTSESALVDLLGDINGVVEDSQVTGLRSAYFLIGGEGPIRLDRDRIPNESDTPRITLVASAESDSNEQTVQVDPEIAADRLFRLVELFGDDAAPAVGGTGSVELEFTSDGAGTPADTVGAALDRIAEDEQLSSWNDGWTIERADSRGSVASVSTRTDLGEDVARAWHDMTASYSSAPADVEYYRLAFEQPFDTWNVYSTIRFTPPVQPAELVPTTWAEALGPLIGAQVDAATTLGDHNLSIANFYGTTTAEFAFDTFVSTNPIGGFDDRGWNTMFLP